MTFDEMILKHGDSVVFCSSDAERFELLDESENHDMSLSLEDFVFGSGCYPASRIISVFDAYTSSQPARPKSAKYLYRLTDDEGFEMFKQLKPMLPSSVIVFEDDDECVEMWCASEQDERRIAALLALLGFDDDAGGQKVLA